MAKISVVGIDLGKRYFHVHGVGEHGEVQIQKRFSRQGLIRWMARCEPCLVGMETCSGANYWARLFGSYGHDVRLMSPQFVKPYVKSNKNDTRDAEAICEAVSRPTMRFVAVKTPQQQELQMLHRVRSRLVGRRTALVNQIRGFLLEQGIAIGRGIYVIRRQLPEVLEEAQNGLTHCMRQLLAELREELVALDTRVAVLDQQLEERSQSDGFCRLLRSIPGIGPLTATALVGAVRASDFRNGRDLAAWAGLVPRQHSTGGQSRLLGISKRGDRYLRMLLIHGARAALRVAHKRNDRVSRWALELEQRRGRNVATVALANKNARFAWAVMAHEQRYCCQPAG
jgi:transposase